MKFSEITGLQELKEKLIRAVNTEKVAHAQMFAGSEGSGNLALALAYATLLNCSNRQENDSCGTCPSCHKMAKLIHPDVHFVYPVSPIKDVKEAISDSFIAEWRDFIIKNPYSGPNEWSLNFGGENKQLNISREESRSILRKLSLKSYEGEYKVMILWLPEYLHPASANALLKILEEPSEMTVFLMVTNDYEQIINTILSRVQMLKVRPFSHEEIATHLQKHHEVSPSKASQLAGISSGNLNHAIHLLEEPDEDTHEMFHKWMRSCFSNKTDEMVEWMEAFGKASKINQRGLLQYGMAILRDCLLKTNNQDALINAGSKERMFVDNFSTILDQEKLKSIYEVLNTAQYHLERNANARIVFLDISLLISSIFNKKQ
ncbi:MAG: DNA polymerase III subunit delta [Cyclobacteriaceae bacterium]|nr:DNA polymerase III subunit delta [Cyclobacteriaceae bacterium]